MKNLSIILLFLLTVFGLNLNTQAEFNTLKQCEDVCKIHQDQACVQVSKEKWNCWPL